MATKFSKDNKGIINNDYSLKDMGNHSANMGVDTGKIIGNLNKENEDLFDYAEDVQSISSLTVNSAQLSGLKIEKLAKNVGVIGDFLTARKFVKHNYY